MLTLVHNLVDAEKEHGSEQRCQVSIVNKNLEGAMLAIYHHRLHHIAYLVSRKRAIKRYMYTRSVETIHSENKRCAGAAANFC
jgi:hypothetical protein